MQILYLLLSKPTLRMNSSNQLFHCLEDFFRPYKNLFSLLYRSDLGHQPERKTSDIGGLIVMVGHVSWVPQTMS